MAQIIAKYGDSGKGLGSVGPWLKNDLRCQIGKRDGSAAIPIICTFKRPDRRAQLFAVRGFCRHRKCETVALIYASQEWAGMSLGLCVCKRFADELDLTLNARLLVVGVTSLDRPDGFDAAQRRFGSSQGTKALLISKEPFYGRMIALDPVITPLPVDVSDAVKMRVIMRVILMIDLVDDAPIGRSFVCGDVDRSMKSHALDRLVEKGHCYFCIPPGGEAEIDHLTGCITSAPEIGPFATDPDVGFVYVPIDACATQVPLCALRQFRRELLDPAKDR